MSDKRQLDTLTGLRFVAAFAVFIHHLGGKFGFAMNRYSIGSLAVTFFFVLSGFILTYVYHDRLNSAADLRRFFFNRFARIWPLHLVCLLLAALIYGGGDLSWIFDEQRIPLLLTNLCLLQSWVPDNEWVFSFNGVSWSISTEAFFYVVFPLLLLRGGRRLAARLLAAASVVAVAIVALNWLSQIDWWQLDYHRIGHVNPLIRLPEFCIGIFVGKKYLMRAQRVQNRSVIFDTLKEVLCIASIVIAAVVVADCRLQFLIAESEWGSQFLASWFRVAYPMILFGTTVYVFSQSSGLISACCSLRSMVYLGEVSFAFYMIHFLVIRQAFFTNLSYGSLDGWLIGALTFGIALGASIVLYEFVEMPGKNWLHSIFYGQKKREGNRGSGLWAMKSGTVAKALLALGLIFGCGYTLQSHAVDAERTQPIAELMQSAEKHVEQVDFGSQYRMQGFRLLPESDRLIMQFVWVKRVQADYRRLVLLLDENDKQIGRARHNQQPFAKADLGQEFLDEVIVPHPMLRKANSVVVCFRRKGKTGLTANKGARKQRDKMLVLLNRQQIESVLESKELRRKSSDAY